MAVKQHTKPLVPSTNGKEPEPRQQSSYLIIHEDGSVDGVRITPDKTGHYTELLLSLASQMLGQFRASLVKVPEDSGDS